MPLAREERFLYSEVLCRGGYLYSDVPYPAGSRSGDGGPLGSSEV